jgi:hypothetical protein
MLNRPPIPVIPDKSALAGGRSSKEYAIAAGEHDEKWGADLDRAMGKGITDCRLWHCDAEARSFETKHERDSATGRCGLTLFLAGQGASVWHFGGWQSSPC